VAVLGVLVGCASSPAHPGDAVQPRDCAISIAAPSPPFGSPTQIGPIAIDANGINLCATLDTSGMPSAYFSVASDVRHVASSGLEGTLQAGDRTWLADGADVNVGTATDMMTELLVSWSPPLGETTPVVVWLRATGSATTHRFYLTLFNDSL
jgi:hypothetical protein